MLEQFPLYEEPCITPKTVGCRSSAGADSNFKPPFGALGSRPGAQFRAIGVHYLTSQPADSGDGRALVAGLCGLLHTSIEGAAVETVAAVELLSVHHVVTTAVAGIDTEVERLVTAWAFVHFAGARVV